METESFNSVTGFGVTAIIEGNSIAIGNRKLMEEYSTDLSTAKNKIEEFSNSGKSVFYVNINGELKGVFAIEDPVKNNSAEVISELKIMNIKTVMITGDNESTAAKIAEKTGVDYYEAEVLPNEKADAVKKYQSKNEIVAMVGDGINDAPALAQSDVGIAIGSGTDIAMETGSIVLMSGDLYGVLSAIKLSKRTLATIKQNLFWAFIYNIIAIPLAISGLLNPIIAEIAMALSSITVVTNSTLLKKIKKRMY